MNDGKLEVAGALGEEDGVGADGVVDGAGAANEGGDGTAGVEGGAAAGLAEVGLEVGTTPPLVCSGGEEATRSFGVDRWERKK